MQPLCKKINTHEKIDISALTFGIFAVALKPKVIII